MTKLSSVEQFDSNRFPWKGAGIGVALGVLVVALSIGLLQLLSGETRSETGLSVGALLVLLSLPFGPLLQPLGVLVPDVASFAFIAGVVLNWGICGAVVTYWLRRRRQKQSVAPGA